MNRLLLLTAVAAAHTEMFGDVQGVAVAKGELSQTMKLEVDGRPLKGEFLRTARVVNTMVGRLNAALL